MADGYWSLSVPLVVFILTGVAVLAGLAAFVYDVLGWPSEASHRTALFFVCLLAIWALACLAIVLIRALM